MDYKSIGKNIRAARIKKKMRQEDAAEKSNISLSYYGAIERGERIPTLEVLIDILNAFGVSADEILYDLVDADYEIKQTLVSNKLTGLSKQNLTLVSDIIDVVKKSSQ